MCNFEAGKLSVGRLVLLKEGFIRNVERKPVTCLTVKSDVFSDEK